MRKLLYGFSMLRIVYAAALLVAPRRATRSWLGEAGDEAGGAVAIRGLAIRDMALSVGVLSAVRAEESARPWLAACAISDAVDVGATLIADGDRLPPRSKVSTAALAGLFGLAGAWLAATDSR